jgi:hypothetical protein
VTVFKGGPVFIDAQPLNRGFQRLAGSPEFRGPLQTVWKIRPWLPARAASILTVLKTWRQFRGMT